MGVGEPAGVSTGAVLGSGVKVARAMGGEGVGGGGVVGVGGAGTHATTKKINAQTNEIRTMEHSITQDARFGNIRSFTRVLQFYTVGTNRYNHSGIADTFSR